VTLTHFVVHGPEVGGERRLADGGAIQPDLGRGVNVKNILPQKWGEILTIFEKTFNIFMHKTRKILVLNLLVTCGPF
jgi:hypothetical protein